MKYTLFALGMILLLAGCAVDPADLALIPTPTPTHHAVHFPVNHVPIAIFDEHGENVTVLDVEQMKNDRWLQVWALDAMEHDGATGLGHIHHDGRTQVEVVVDDYVMVTFYMNSFATAELRCVESREELSALVETYADKIKDMEFIVFPRLVITDTLSRQLTVGDTNCNDFLVSLPEFPIALFHCLGDNQPEPCNYIGEPTTTTAIQ